MHMQADKINTPTATVPPKWATSGFWAPVETNLICVKEQTQLLVELTPHNP